MFPCVGFGYGLWWIFPIIMIAMIIFCFFMMRRHGMGCCGRGEHRPGDGNDSSLK